MVGKEDDPASYLVLVTFLGVELAVKLREGNWVFNGGNQGFFTKQKAMILLMAEIWLTTWDGAETL